MPNPSKTGPIIIMSILLTMLFLSIGAIALIISFNSNRPTGDELTVACKDQVGGAISAEYAKVVDACKQETVKAEEKAKENAFNKVEGAINRPGFIYPSAWTAVGRTLTSNKVTYLMVDVSSSFISYCEDCDGPLVDVRMITTKKDTAKITAAGSFKTYVTSLYPEAVAPAPGYSNVVVTEGTVNAQNVIIVTGHSTGLGDSDFEHIFFEAPTYLVEVDKDIDPTSTNKEALEVGWTVIKNSLDFSKIE